MKVAMTVRIKNGEEVEQAWIWENAWIEVNRPPGSVADVRNVRRLLGKEGTSRLVETSESARVWTVK